MIGGGNTALDAIRSALRLGARKAYVIYRRGDAEMPVRAEEVHHARQEGIDFRMLTAPVEFVCDGKGWLTTARADGTRRTGFVGTQTARADQGLGV